MNIIVHLNKLTFVFILSTCCNLYFINGGKGCCCCKGNKFQDVNSGSKEINKGGGIKKNNKKK